MKYNPILITIFSLSIAFVANNVLAKEKAKTLADLDCAADEIAKFDGATWACATDVDTNTNAATECSAEEVLLGDGSCADISVVATHRTDYFSIPAEAFVSAGGNETITSLGAGGAYLSEPLTTYMVAPVHLPHGANITRFTMNFVDNSTSDLHMALDVRPHNDTGLTELSSLNSSGVSGDSQNVDSLAATLSHNVNNNGNGYFVRVFSPWPGTVDLRIISAVVEYTIGVAP